MKISEVITAIDIMSESKLHTIRIVNDLRGGGLRKSKEIVDEIYTKTNCGKRIIDYLKLSDEWSEVKRNIRKLKTL